MDQYILANCTDTGLVRQVNEDSMTTFDSPNGRVLVVCDGMGGQNAGDVASQLAVAVIQDILSDNTFATPAEAITQSIMAANQAILRRAAQNGELSGMGSTCVMLIIKDGLVYYGSVGDSRIYYADGTGLVQLTRDQSYVQTLVDEGKLTPFEAEHHKDKNQITNALGVEGMTPPVVCQTPITPAPGSIFLLCSDGLSGMVSSASMLATLQQTGLSLKERADELVSKANQAGGTDNITVQLVEFEANPGAAMGTQSGVMASRAAKKSHAVYYALLAFCFVLIGGALGWYFFQPEPEPEPEPAPAVKAETPQPKPAPKAQPAQRTETVVIKQQQPAPKKQSTSAPSTKRKGNKSVQDAAQQNGKGNKQTLQNQAEQEPGQKPMRTIPGKEPQQ
ncbi:MAG: Stp1/IreP family PP2C-type Ser/Thr phosphatase [Alloprevotella sp.]